MADPLGPIIVDPLAVITFGFIGTYNAALAGVGLNTFGFLWPENAVFVECANCSDAVETTWIDCEGC